MCKNFLFLLAVLIACPTAVWAQEVVQRDAGLAPVVTPEGGKGYSKAKPFKTDQRIVDLQGKYMRRYKELCEKEEAEQDPIKKTKIERQIEKVKAEEEVAVLELTLGIAVESDDAERVISTQEALNKIYHPKPLELSEPDSTVRIEGFAPHTKRPDDRQ